uniref:Uncharacterized protein n=1 Tax=Panagrolaimus sp. PS1159 TaxID=55785 RepID=A0AC35GDR4_9BILA
MNNEMLKESMAEAIYFLTSKPVTYERLSYCFSILGSEFNLEKTCELLGYYSFNECLRQNQKLFKFLTVFVCRNNGEKDESNPFLLHYYNNTIENHRNYRPELLAHGEAFDNVRAAISFDETFFFEFHNSIAFIEGRKEFVKLVGYCQMKGLTNQNGMIPLCKMNQAFNELYGIENFSTKLKTWFPNLGGTENIVQKVFFDDVDYSLSDPLKKKETEFRLKDGWYSEDTVRKLDEIKENFENIKERIGRDIYMQRHALGGFQNKEMNSSGHCIPNTQKHYNIARQKRSKIFYDSDNEVDLRVENAPHKEPSKPFVPVVKKPELANIGKGKEDDMKPAIMEKKYNIFDDRDIDDIFEKINVMENAGQKTLNKPLTQNFNNH